MTRKSIWSFDIFHILSLANLAIDIFLTENFICNFLSLVNTPAAEKLYSKIREWCDITEDTTVLGTFSFVACEIKVLFKPAVVERNEICLRSSIYSFLLYISSIKNLDNFFILM